MAESLRRIVNLGSFSVLQEKAEQWLDTYKINSCEQNVTRCCELIEANSRMQGQLFKLLSLTAAEGGAYGGATTLKSRLLPWLGSGVLAAVPDPSFTALAQVAAKDRELNEVTDMYERSIQTLEEDLSQSRAEADELKAVLDETKDELSTSHRASVSDKMFSENEITDLRTQLRNAQDDLASYRARASLVDNYERQVRQLRDEVAILSGRREALMNGSLPEPVSLTSSLPLPLPRPASPFAPDDITQRVRQQNLITRYNDMFAHDRMDALDILRAYSSDHENNQRIIFAIVQEAFTVARLAFTNWKLKIRSSLAITHSGPDTLEEAVQDYINRNTDLVDLPSLVSDVIRALNRNSRIALPDASYGVVQPFIREACKMAWNMSCLASPLDISIANDAELFDDHKYRRSYDSEFTAPLVNHHIWPCLMQTNKIIVKGECCTRRGASLSSRRSRSRSPKRSISPTRSLSPFRSLSAARSRSPSPRRLESSLSGVRSSSRASSSPSRAITASTRLSHYGVQS